ncbi:MAG: hypothetical protein K6A65_00005, partial [Succinivibrionaceae bacterium]|nr:hypothetical protein [Succinivibrionaceae bacterium]
DTLYHAGIQADFYAATERTPDIADTLDLIPDQEYLSNILLIAGDVVHPRTAAHFRHTMLFAKLDEPFGAMLPTRLPKEQMPRGITLMNPLVGNLGLAAALYLRFRHIYLFGIDNGTMGDSGQFHSRYSSLYDAGKWGAASGTNSSNLNQEVPGNFGGVALSGGLMRTSAHNMEMVIDLFRNKEGHEFEVQNCSNGVLIKGTTPRHSEDLDFSSLPRVDHTAFREMIAGSMLTRLGLGRPELLDFIKVKDCKKVTGQLRLQWKKRPRTRLAFLRLMQDCAEYFDRINNSRQRFASYMIEGSIHTFFILALKGLYQDGNEQLCLRSANAVIDRMCDFLRDADRLLDFLPDYVIGEHQRLAKGLIGCSHEGSPAPRMPAIPTFQTRQGWQDPMQKFTKVTE